MAEKEIKGIKKFLEEFKAFAMRGNVLDMAVGVVIGSAFTAIVNSLWSMISSTPPSACSSMRTSRMSASTLAM